jgi:heme a synthase
MRAMPPTAKPRRIAQWLFAVAALVVLIVAIGGITRLTESGLSITEWKPVTGTLPPLTEAQWQAEFRAYQQIGEFQQVAGPQGMTLADYKFIYFWEWFHRLLARIIGLAFALPLAWFWLKGAIPTGYKPRLLALLALGGLQGALGWLMVRSGLNTQMTDVSHFWLSAHLLTALFTLGGLLWTARDLLRLAADNTSAPARLTGLAGATLAVLFVQLLLSERFLPQFDGARGWLFALTHDPFLLHWLHRWWAWVAVVFLVLLARAAKRSADRRAAVLVHATLGLQIVLGIATVMTGVALWLAVAHQLVGALLVAASAWAANRLGWRERTAG